MEYGRESLVILVSCASGKVPLIRAVKSAACRIQTLTSVIAGDISPDVLSAYVADDFWLMPLIKDEAFDLIVDGCLRRNVDIILPTRDSELLFWAKHKERLSMHGITVIISPVESLFNCIDKLAFSALGTLYSLPIIPATTDVNELSSLLYVVKERYGSGSRSVGVGLDRDQALNYAAALAEPIFQPFMRGREFSVDAWLDSAHRVKACVMRWRNVVVDGEAKVTTTFSDHLLELKIVRVLEALRLRGPVVLQAIQDDKSNLHVIECNARFGGCSTASIKVGLDTLFWSFVEALGYRLADYEFIRSPKEVRQVRVSEDIYIYDPDF